MEEPGEAQSVPVPVTTNVQPHLSIWLRLKGFGLKKIFLICVGIGTGLGIGVVVTVASVVWLTSRSIPARDWPPLEVQGAGLRAKLRTDWNDSVRYQLVVTPRSSDLEAAFDDTVRSHRDSISFTIYLYDKDGFELCKKKVKPIPLVGTESRIAELEAKDTLYSFECSRSNYKKADHWSFAYVFPALTADIPSGGAVGPWNKYKKAQPQQTSRQENAPTEEDDTLTGFDLYSGHLETLSGNTFLVREGEKDTVWEWNYKVSEGGRQPGLHITCKTKADCVIENTTNSQTVHGKRIR